MKRLLLTFVFAALSLGIAEAKCPYAGKCKPVVAKAPSNQKKNLCGPTKTQILYKSRLKTGADASKSAQRSNVSKSLSKDECVICGSRDGTRNVRGTYYCAAHYCSKHERVVSDKEDKCTICRLESTILRGHATCKACNVQSRDKIRIVENTKGEFELACVKHICVEHQEIFTPSKDGRLACAVCEKTYNKDGNYFILREPLESFLGINLGAELSSIDTIAEEEPYRSFKPAQPFRNFSTYLVIAKGGKIIGVETRSEIEGKTAAKKEFATVMEVLDSRYGKVRREQGRKLTGKKDTFIFGFDRATDEIAGQRVELELEKVQGTKDTWTLVLSAYEASESNSYDIQAL